MDDIRARSRLMSESILCKMQYVCLTGIDGNARLFSSQHASRCYGDLAGKSNNENNNIELPFTPSINKHSTCH